MLEEFNDSGTTQARYTTEDGSCYGTWLNLCRTSGNLSRPLVHDSLGSGGVP